MFLTQALPSPLLPFIALALLSATLPTALAVPVVNLGYATYQGVPNSKGHVDFLGIRFAAPPVGNLRFRAPQAPATVAGVQMANAHPNMCSQGPLALNPRSPWRQGQPLRRQWQIPATSEDCLFLNVVVPGQDINPNLRLPVVVWIHGGGYMSGSGSYPGVGPPVYYDGNDLVDLSNNGAIVVIIQYRVGLFGFLSSVEVRENGNLNVGLLDQEFALKWVRNHIAKFGGDRDRVTIWGESAGAGSVLQHLVANNGQTNPRLFKNAILSSSFLPSQYWYHERVPQGLYAEVLSQAGCASAANKLNCLRSVPYNTLVEINDAIGTTGGFFGTFVFVPVVDGIFIVDRPTALIDQNRLNQANVLAVTNTLEGVLFVHPDTVVNTTDYIAQLFPEFPSTQIPNFAAQYTSVGSAYEQAVAIMGEAIFICPTYTLLRTLSGKAYKAEYAIPPGAHADDVYYYFPSTGPAPFNNQQFITTFAGQFLDFAMTENPNANRAGSILPQWPKWSISNSKEVVFNRDGNNPAISIQNSQTSLVQRCNFWKSVSESTRQ